MVGIKVRHLISESLGTGTVIKAEGNYIWVEFSEKTFQLAYPGAFKKHLEAVDPAIQAKIEALINGAREAEEKKRLEEEAAKKDAEDRRLAAEADRLAAAEKRTIRADFGPDYHAEHLSLDKCFTYQDVEAKYGINRRGYGQGINVLGDKIVLISSVDRADGAYVYHDKWTKDGDFIYSGEGSRGDQSLTGNNLAIKNSKDDKKEIHLYVKFSSQRYYYQGIFEYVTEIKENDKDADGNIRKEYKFRLRRV